MEPIFENSLAFPVQMGKKNQENTVPLKDFKACSYVSSINVCMYGSYVQYKVMDTPVLQAPINWRCGGSSVAHKANTIPTTKLTHSKPHSNC